MKLSEAIRLGGMLSRGDVRCALYEYGRTCAMGGALLAAGALQIFEDGWRAYEKYGQPDPFPIRSTIIEACPGCRGALDSHRKVALELVIFLLFDVHRWSRDQIAGWVETIEGNVGGNIEGNIEETTERNNPVDPAGSVETSVETVEEPACV